MANPPTNDTDKSLITRSDKYIEDLSDEMVVSYIQTMSSMIYTIHINIGEHGDISKSIIGANAGQLEPSKTPHLALMNQLSMWFLTDGFKQIVALTEIPTSSNDVQMRKFLWTENSDLPSLKNLKLIPIQFLPPQKDDADFRGDWFEEIAAIQMGSGDNSKAKKAVTSPLLFSRRLEYQLQKLSKVIGEMSKSQVDEAKIKKEYLKEVSDLEDLVLLSCIEKIHARLNRSISVDYSGGFNKITWLDLFTSKKDLALAESLGIHSFADDKHDEPKLKFTDDTKDESIPGKLELANAHPFLKGSSESFMAKALASVLEKKEEDFVLDSQNLLQTYSSSSSQPTQSQLHKGIGKLLAHFYLQIRHLQLLLRVNESGLSVEENEIYPKLRLAAINTYREPELPELDLETVSKTSLDKAKEVVSKRYVASDLAKDEVKEVMKYRMSALKACLQKIKRSMNVLDKIANFSPTFFQLVHGKLFTEYLRNTHNAAIRQMMEPDKKPSAKVATSSDPADEESTAEIASSSDPVRLWLQLCTQWIHVFQGLRSKNKDVRAPILEFFQTPSTFIRTIAPDVVRDRGSRTTVINSLACAGFDKPDDFKKYATTFGEKLGKNKSDKTNTIEAWEQTIRPKTHCECTISLECVREGTEQVLVGVSKKCCFLCNLWIQEFNNQLPNAKRKYTTIAVHSYHSKIYQWSPPAWIPAVDREPPGQRGEVTEFARLANRQVLKHLAAALRKALSQQGEPIVIPDTGTSGDEFIKPDLGNDEYDST